MPIIKTHFLKKVFLCIYCSVRIYPLVEFSSEFGIDAAHSSAKIEAPGVYERGECDSFGHERLQAVRLLADLVQIVEQGDSLCCLFMQYNIRRCLMYASVSVYFLDRSAALM